ncbi:MAG: AbrB/MazE/SpoVT family DNA-binding domain-containing protein [Candidatus Omnitrophica bacterium]|nr:AbrB/MazE/SpoVT family DNA-binding domain-containing protein [Candidatus Omnitrophota bacterium]MDD5573611.1 AbrB/MazE/SpoVT family DNA-binding domain-containing protein [Candidatus Omnitrophota bacterium]
MSRLMHPKVYGTVTVGGKGQVVIPVELRKLLKINANDKLVVLSKGRDMIGLVPVEEFSRFLAEISILRESFEAKTK